MQTVIAQVAVIGQGRVHVGDLEVIRRKFQDFVDCCREAGVTLNASTAVLASDERDDVDATQT